MVKKEKERNGFCNADADSYCSSSSLKTLYELKSLVVIS